jgi:hypothetical protein
MSKKITKKDLKKHPEWEKRGLRVGDDIPQTEPSEESEGEAEEDDTGGSAPPPNKDRGGQP